MDHGGDTTPRSVPMRPCDGALESLKVSIQLRLRVERPL